MKKILLSLFIGFVGLFSFCSATVYNCTSTGCDPRYVVFDPPYDGRFYADLISQSSNNLELHYYMKCRGDNFLREGTVSISTLTEGPLGGITCNRGDKHFQFLMLDYLTSDGFASFSYTGDSSGGGGSCPEINTGEILSGYILESEIDINYCVGNGLCPNECGSGSDFSGDLQYSNIYINSILHPGKQNIFIDIPDYITRDYSSTGDDFNLYVGSGYDVDYINSVIDINSYRPSSSDFTNIFVSGLTLIFPYIFITLLLLFIWKFIKKFFK